MRFLIENPPFGTPWSGDNAKQGQEDAVKAEFVKDGSRWGSRPPSWKRFTAAVLTVSSCKDG